MPEVPAPFPPDELERIGALRAYRILDSGPEPAYDDLTELASHICGTPIALVSLVDSERQWFKSRVGLDAEETPRDLAFCAHAILTPDELFQIPNATSDPRFADNPLVTGPPDIRFYAGAPLVTPEGRAVGTLCVIDREPRLLTNEQAEALRALARQVVAQMELRLALTDRERVIQGLEELSQARENFLATASHELRTPLTSIHGALRLIEGGVAGVLDSEGQELLEIATANAGRLVQLVNDLLDLSKVQAEGGALERVPISALELLERGAKELQPVASERGVELRSEGDAELSVSGDREKLTRLLRNLLANAIRFSPEGETVVLAAEQASAQRVRLRVTDRGPGISAADQERLFVPFSQVGERRGREGTSGLGLAIVKSIAEAHGGTVGVESAPGQGSSFWVELPA